MPRGGRHIGVDARQEAGADPNAALWLNCLCQRVHQVLTHLDLAARKLPSAIASPDEANAPLSPSTMPATAADVRQKGHRSLPGSARTSKTASGPGDALSTPSVR